MESYGLYAACDSMHTPKPDFFCLKSICDFADKDKGSDYQKYASYISANIFNLFVTTFESKL